MTDTENHVNSVTEDDIDEVVRAISNFNPLGDNQLPLKKGDIVNVKEKTSEHWWWAEVDGRVGFVPVNHVSCHTHQQLVWEDEEYFGQYSKLKIHHEMLSDRPRTIAYQSVIQRNAEFLRGKRILDVGCGTGILSLMCAKYAQPSKVIAVEASDIAEDTADIVKCNGYDDVITVHNDYVEELNLQDKVDVIISEWMGTALLFEMMIESVIIARDKYLNPNGKMWPSIASLYLVPCSSHDQHHKNIAFWEDQYGFSFSPLIAKSKSDVIHKPIYNHVLAVNDCLSEEKCILTLDMSEVTVSELESNVCVFTFTVTKDDVLHGFCCWFQVDFIGYENIERVILNTGPKHDLTHWKQNLFLLDKKHSVSKGDIVSGRFHIYRNEEWRRHLRVNISFTISKDDVKVVTEEKLFHIWR